MLTEAQASLARAFILSRTFKVAKSGDHAWVAEHPNGEIDHFALLVDEYGEFETYYFNRPMKYLTVDGWKYWTVKAKSDGKWIINRFQPGVLDGKHRQRS